MKVHSYSSYCFVMMQSISNSCGGRSRGTGVLQDTRRWSSKAEESNG